MAWMAVGITPQAGGWVLVFHIKRWYLVSLFALVIWFLNELHLNTQSAIIVYVCIFE